MTTEVKDRIANLEKELISLRKCTTIQRAVLISLFGVVGLLICVGAKLPRTGNGHFDTVFANSVIIRNAKGDSAVQLYSVEGAGSLLIRDSSGREAIHLISGPERNDLFINDRIAVALQGMKDQGRLSLHRTFADKGAAEEALGKRPREYLGHNNEDEVTVPILRLPEALR